MVGILKLMQIHFFWGKLACDSFYGLFCVLGSVKKRSFHVFKWNGKKLSTLKAKFPSVFH